MFKPHIEGKEDYFINPETVYNVAKIEQIKGIWNIFRVLKMHNQLKSMKQNDEAIKQSIIVNMKLDNVSVESILEDAVKRDRALDISGNMIKNKAEKFKSEITQKIDKLKSELSVDEKKLSDLNEKYNKWQTEKIAQETELTKAVSILASGKLISIDEKPDSAPAAAPSGSSPQPQAQPKPQQPAANPQ